MVLVVRIRIKYVCSFNGACMPKHHAEARGPSPGVQASRLREGVIRLSAVIRCFGQVVDEGYSEENPFQVSLREIHDRRERGLPARAMQATRGCHFLLQPLGLYLGGPEVRAS